MYLMVGKKRVLDIENYRQEVIKKIQALHYNQSSWSVNGRIRVPLQIADRFCGLFIFRWLFAAF